MLVFKGDRLLVRDGVLDHEFSSELASELPRILRNSPDLPAPWQGLAPWCELENTRETEEAGKGREAVGNSEWLDLREVWARWGDEVFARAGAAYQYMNWMRRTRFCMACGEPLAPAKSERGLHCAKCDRVIYAPLHPAIIVAVERDGKLLLAHNTRMPPKRYSVLAGFVEPGESLEQTVAREVMEEVSIEVGDIRYFGSQGWPFPCSLMLGFTARWKKGELRPDGVELDDAGWFAPGELPDIPAKISISRRLIDDFLHRMNELSGKRELN